MSGGHFNHSQYHILQIAEEIENIIENNDSKELNRYGDRIGHGWPNEVIVEFKNAVNALKTAYVYAQRVDWLVSGDDGTDSFHTRLQKELEELK